jgi:hypothetical protein
MILGRLDLPLSLRNALRRLAPVVCSAEVEDLGLVNQVVDDTILFCRALSPAARAGLYAGLMAFDVSASLHPTTFGRRFSRLSGDEAAKHFDRWWHSRIPLCHDFAKGIKGAMAIAYFELPTIQDRIDYHPQAWIKEASARRVERYGKSIAEAEANLLRDDPLV